MRVCGCSRVCIGNTCVIYKSKQGGQMNITLGQIAFEAYSKAMGGKTYDGKNIPHWNDLSAQVQKGWTAAARAVSGMGGAYIGGSVNVTGDFIGRDKKG